MTRTPHHLNVHGACVFDTPSHTDSRGEFSVLFERQAWVHQHLNPSIIQINHVFNPQRLTLRGLHYQLAPHAEAKTIRCLTGTIYDVVLDIRPESRTYRQWAAYTLTSPTQALYVPEGCAHGYLTLEPNTTVLYTVSKPYVPAVAHGIRWNDPTFSIDWPEQPQMIAERDASYPNYFPAG